MNQRKPQSTGKAGSFGAASIGKVPTNPSGSVGTRNLPFKEIVRYLSDKPMPRPHRAPPSK